MKYDTLKALVNAKVYENTEQEITGEGLNEVLQSAIASLGAHYQMGGLVSPNDKITVGDEPVVFLATTPGTYTYFGGIVVADGEVALLVWSGTAWSKQTPDIATGTEVSQLGQENIDISKIITEIIGKTGLDSGVVLSSDSDATAVTNRIFISKPPIRLKRINAISFIGVVSSTINFYKITISGTNVNYELIKSVTPTANGEYTIKLDNELSLGENDYIGVNGTFKYTNNTTDTQSCVYNIESEVLSAWAYQSLSFNLLFIGEFDEIKDDVSQLEKDEKNTENIVSEIIDFVTISDKYDLSGAGSVINQPQMIYFVRPIVRIDKINCIEYASVVGTTYFYIVTYDGESLSYELLKTEINETSGIKRVLFDSPITISENQYIGIGGNMQYAEITGKGYGVMSYNISTSSIDAVWHQRNFFFNAIYIGDKDLSTEIKKVKEEIYNTVDDFVDQDYGTTFDIPESYSVARYPQTIYLIKKIKNIHSINKISFFALNGNVQFYKVKYVDGSAEIIAKQQIASVELSSEDYGKIKNIVLDSRVSFDNDDYIGISGDNLAFFALSDDDGLHYSKDVSSLNTVAPSNSWRNRNFFVNAENVSDSLLRVGLDYCKEEIEKINDDISALKNQFVRKFGTKILFNEAITQQSTDIVMMDGSEKVFDTYGLEITSGNGAFVNKCYALGDFNVSFRCKFAQNSRIYICGIQKGTNSLSNGATLNIQNNSISIGSGSFILQNPINTDHEYLISLRKLYEIAILEIRDMQGGTYETFIYQHTGPGGSGAGATYPSNLYVSYWDKPLIGVTSGSVSVKSIKIDTAACKILFYGDSITEGQNYWPKELFEKYWINQVIKMANGNAQTSARSGYGLSDILSFDQNDNIDNANSRIGNELQYIKPKYVVITIGTNGGVTKSGLVRLVNYIKSQNAIPILNHIPTFKHGTNPDTFISTNSTIDTVRTEEEIIGADFDKATSADGLGTTCDITQFWLEGDGGESSYYHHPNVKGSNTMFARLLIDTPEIFDV